MTNLITWLPGPIIPVVGVASWGLGILLDIALFMVLYLALPHDTPTGARFYPAQLAPVCSGRLPRKPS